MSEGRASVTPSKPGHTPPKHPLEATARSSISRLSRASVLSSSDDGESETQETVKDLIGDVVRRQLGGGDSIETKEGDEVRNDGEKKGEEEGGLATDAAARTHVEDSDREGKRSSIMSTSNGSDEVGKRPSQSGSFRPTPTKEKKEKKSDDRERRASTSSSTAAANAVGEVVGNEKRGERRRSSAAMFGIKPSSRASSAKGKSREKKNSSEEVEKRRGSKVEDRASRSGEHSQDGRGGEALAMPASSGGDEEGLGSAVEVERKGETEGEMGAPSAVHAPSSMPPSGGIEGETPTKAKPVLEIEVEKITPERRVARPRPRQKRSTSTSSQSGSVVPTTTPSTSNLSSTPLTAEDKLKDTMTVYSNVRIQRPRRGGAGGGGRPMRAQAGKSPASSPTKNEQSATPTNSKVSSLRHEVSQARDQPSAGRGSPKRGEARPKTPEEIEAEERTNKLIEYGKRRAETTVADMNARNASSPPRQRTTPTVSSYVDVSSLDLRRYYSTHQLRRASDTKGEGGKRRKEKTGEGNVEKAEKEAAKGKSLQPIRSKDGRRFVVEIEDDDSNPLVQLEKSGLMSKIREDADRRERGIASPPLRSVSTAVMSASSPIHYPHPPASSSHAHASRGVSKAGAGRPRSQIAALPASATASGSNRWLNEVGHDATSNTAMEVDNYSPPFTHSVGGGGRGGKTALTPISADVKGKGKKGDGRAGARSATPSSSPTSPFAYPLHGEEMEFPSPKRGWESPVMSVDEKQHRRDLLPSAPSPVGMLPALRTGKDGTVVREEGVMHSAAPSPLLDDRGEKTGGGKGEHLPPSNAPSRIYPRRRLRV
eukprot:CAMPEP_0113885610 /NCGR_PEP_ID=MMETSP0780_2-20120614/11020_1 /TAXON_ID=652834 /ORGANISM="Palpitomonas bilix" /LENGTH=823 /DNA_ID=CAMNT_0000873583 /DNA_START=429 /DNA_END=2900 /DNA_ORIENTATION=+ /assembly_acc=CAM_ASM_000599